ncbi:uncharacterized protein LOC143194060 isoform X2 [Rhynchophorus ferrugineus]|uniref:Uncharacterized protein n=1 Tax=Rhynchophorus ferrugineus TaxID=354439 RepID=A0A834IRG6_RHYFE|nr:hypothetical protein GWI33_009966 [Rhynchophorus ferrugineus]
MNPLPSAFILNYIIVYFIRSVVADYCEFGTCDEKVEYCCGENKCCKKTVDVWYYWAAVLLVITTITIAACLYMKKLKNKYKTYSKLEQQFDDVTTCT